MEENNNNYDWVNSGMLNDKIMALFSSPNLFGAFFGGGIYKEKTSPYESLGKSGEDLYELRPIEILAEGGQFVLDNGLKYSHLYHNGVKVSDKVFRKGGLGGRFKDGYCDLIYYTEKKEHTEKELGFDYGTHVIINLSGDICLSGKSLDYPHHIGGHLASLGSLIYDLRTGKAIMTKSSSYISGKNSIIVEHRYDWYNKELEIPIGIYSIDFQTAEVKKIDDVK